MTTTSISLSMSPAKHNVLSSTQSCDGVEFHINLSAAAFFTAIILVKSMYDSPFE